MTKQFAGREATSFMFNRSAECMPRAELAALQLERQKKLECAYAEVLHFRRKFDAAHVKPENLKSLDSSRALPLHAEIRPAR